MRRSEYRFKTVDRAIESTMDTLALANAVKSPSYGVPTAGSTDPQKKISTGERFQEAGWILGLAKRSLAPFEYAWLTLTYDQPGEARERALDTLTSYFSKLCRKQDLLRALIEREFMFGEKWCKTVAQVARDVGASVDGGNKAVARIRPALATLGIETNAMLLKAFKKAGYAHSVDDAFKARKG